jgi:hypothetical protein
MAPTLVGDGPCLHFLLSPFVFDNRQPAHGVCISLFFVSGIAMSRYFSFFSWKKNRILVLSMPAL